jgi:hypothetical protein
MILPTIDVLLARVGAVLFAALAVGLLGLVPVRVGRVRIPVLAASLGAALSVLAL